MVGGCAIEHTLGDINPGNRLIGRGVDTGGLSRCGVILLIKDMGDTMLDIECKHYFHKECLTEYLKKYNHICPVCRKEIGESKVNY